MYENPLNPNVGQILDFGFKDRICFFQQKVTCTKKPRLSSRFSHSYEISKIINPKGFISILGFFHFILRRKKSRPCRLEKLLVKGIHLF